MSNFVDFEQQICLLSFYGSRVNVTALPYSPFWEKREGPNNTTLYSGADYYTLVAIAAALNFTIGLLSTSSWGEVRNTEKTRG